MKLTSDGFHAAFAAAHDAIDAAVAGQLALADQAWGETGPLLVRMGVHACEAESRDGDYYGSGVNRAARLTAVANGGQIVVSLASSELVRDSEFELGRSGSASFARSGACRAAVPGGVPPEAA